MTFREEALKSRVELKRLRLENARLRRSNEALRKRVRCLEQENRILRHENQQLKQQVNRLNQTVQLQEKQIESLQLMVEELRGMVFGKKKATEDGDNSSAEESMIGSNGQTKKRKSANREASSYRRPAPSDTEVTDVVEHSLTHCPDCGTQLLAIKTIIRYVEDIQDLTTLSQLLKRIEKHLIGSGYCPKCRKRKIAQDISPQVSILGDNVKKFVAYLCIIMRLSFEQVRQFLKDNASFDISDGEIVASLDEQAEQLIPEQNRILQRVRAAPGRHYDETGWSVQKEGQGNYCWITTGTKGQDTIFLMGRSRGIGNAEELRGDVDNQVGISDDYAAYDNLFKKHQLCMSHPKRKLRDLYQSTTLSGDAKRACTRSYEAFSKLYRDLEETLAGSYQKAVWLEKREKYIKRLLNLAQITDADPRKLQAIKYALTQNAEKYFTCLREPGIPADNNKAERGLRHIVLKRKISYGSKSQKGADTMSILYSTLLSCRWNKPDNFFAAYNQMLSP